MVYEIAFWAALILAGIGIVHRIDAWFLRDVGAHDRNVAPSRRLGVALKGIVATIFSPRLFGVLKVLVVDVLFQGRILRDRRDRLAWVMHIAIFWGFLLLLVFHALGSVFGGTIAAAGYVSTLNPFLALRNAAGLLLVVGLALAVARRARRAAGIRTGAADVTALVFLAVIGGSGFLLESVKITSHAVFTTMVNDYVGGLPDDQTLALRTYWVQAFGLVSPSPVPSHDPAVLAAGQEVHEAACASCHDRPQAAFVSYGLSRAIAPVASGLDAAVVRTGLWYLHVLASLAGLAWLAFSKMFHVVGTPVSLVVAEVAGTSRAAGVVATRQAIELDGCRHGGACHDDCPVRLRRVDRIGAEPPYEPMLAYLDEKSAADLGSRPVQG